ncbi:MAG: glycosyltransferase family 4 protein [Methanobacterium sp.]|jgi:glycosyltransferase involved in cell wall biosynthesis|uniref:glycosyltransferase family 4 protein n=1 Tax=Methanobacterium sp. TaxID=2164 RepID=UPI002589E968|nr:glycosyltransferase family 4 protein [Methanobacterium sp.]MCC7559620.1 glycosyltransferase family 4 protein [Methanobacterium sp.]
MSPESSRIVFIHNTAMWYRRPFFSLLSEIYPIKFVFTHLDVSKEIYDVEIDDKIDGMKNVDYTILKNYLSIAFGVIRESLGDYDIIVGGSWDSLPEIIETTLYFVIAKLRRKKFVLWTEDWNWNIKTTKRKLVKFFARIIVKNSDAIILPGTKQKECVMYLGASPSKVFLMPNASNISQTPTESPDKIVKLKSSPNMVNTSNLRDQYPSFKDKKIVLFVGRLVKQKGVDYLLNAFSTLKKGMNDVVLVIIGKGDYEKKLKKLAEDLQIEKDVCFQGHVDNDLLKNYYGPSDLCVVPSITHEMVDAWAFVVNEAMYYENPVIASDAVGSAFDMIKNGENGFIVPEKDSKALYDAMKVILSNDELREKMGKRSKKIVETGFSYKNMVEGFQNAINFVKK